jgi:hypothetical protein
MNNDAGYFAVSARRARRCNTWKVLPFVRNAADRQNRLRPNGLRIFSIGAVLPQAARTFQVRLRLRRLAQSENMRNHCSFNFFTGPKAG